MKVGKKVRSLLSDIGIEKKLWLCISLPVLMLICMIGIGYYATKEAADVSDHIVKKQVAKIAYAYQMIAGARQVTSEMYAAVLEPDPKLAGLLLDRAQDTTKALDGMSLQMKYVFDDEASRKTVTKVLDARTPFVESETRFVALLRDKTKRSEALKEFTQITIPADEWYIQSLQDVVLREKAAMEDVNAKWKALTMDSMRVVLAGGILAVLLSLLFAAAIGRIIRAPINRAVYVATEMAKGNLDVEITDIGKDETGVLLDAMHKMSLALKANIEGILATSRQLSRSAREIAQGNTDLSQRTEEQAASIEETSASMENISANTQTNADNAKKANGLAAEAAEMAKDGETAIGAVRVDMTSIEDASGEVVSVLNSMENLALDIKVLSLNASVEAGRYAGDAGNSVGGFAVVAQEVRDLSGRMNHFTSDIKKLVAKMTKAVQSGSGQVSAAANTMGKIIVSSQRVRDIMGEIASASAEQANGISQVSRALSQMDEATQRNAALVEEASSTAQGLSAIADRMQESVMSLRVKSDAAATESEAKEKPAITPIDANKQKETRALSATHSTSVSAKRKAAAIDQQGAWEAIG